MQENEMLKLFQAIREIFPESFLQLLDKNNHIIQETPRSEYYPDEPVSYSGFKEIVSLKNAQGEAFYKLLPIFCESGTGCRKRFTDTCRENKDVFI